MPDGHIIIGRQVDTVIVGQELVDLRLVAVLGLELLYVDIDLVLACSRDLLCILNGLSHFKKIEKSNYKR